MPNTTHDAVVFIPRFSLAEVIDGAPDEPHPAFLRGGRVLDGIRIAKYPCVIRDGAACSVQGADPATGIDYDTAARACSARGRGWHLMTAMEWGAVALLCRRDGWLPWGNNAMGRDWRETGVTAQIAFRDDERGICRTAAGTGPVEWSHNRRHDGIFDLNGNVWEWNAGLRLVRGELQLQPDPDSPDWFALDAATGGYIAPRGDGCTPGSVKLDWRDGWLWDDTAADRLARPRFCPYADLRATERLSPRAKLILTALACLPVPDPDAYAGVDFYANNGADERMLFRGGRYGQGQNAGVFKSCIDDPRTYTGPAVGFRAAGAWDDPA